MQKNVVLFRGFCAMKYAVYALFANAHKYAECTECELVQQQLPEADTDQTTTSLKGASGFFLFVLPRLVCFSSEGGCFNLVFWS